MRSFIIAAVASFTLTAAACAVLAWTTWGRVHAEARSGSLHDVSAHRVRSLPLWIPG